MKNTPNTTLTEPNLWQKMLGGDKEAFEQIYQNNARLLTTYGKKITPNREIINDAIQDVFINLWQKKDQLPKVDNVKAYLLKSLRNRILRILESRMTEHDEAQPNQAMVESFESYLIQEELASENLQRLYLSIEKLPTRQKEVINLKYFQNLNTEEIAEVLNINYQSVSNLLYKSIKTLKKQAQLPSR